MGEKVLFSWTLWETQIDGPMHMGIYITSFLPLVLYGLALYILIGMYFNRNVF